MSDISTNIEEIQEAIITAANRSGRNPLEITIVAVTKKVLPELIEQSVALGLVALGESKVQEAKAKIPLVSARAKWHMIGHLQSNKARDAIELFDMIHSVDSFELAQSLNKWAERAGKIQPVLLQVNVSGERSKYGMPLDKADDAVKNMIRLPHLGLQGLMTMAPFSDDQEKTRPYFRRLRELRDDLQNRQHCLLPELSMGMSQDYVVAVEEGSTIVRIGSSIFGTRDKHDTEK